MATDKHEDRTGRLVTEERPICESCGERVDEVCGGEYCRGCHVSLTFESCVDGSWVNTQRAAAGMPPVDP